MTGSPSASQASVEELVAQVVRSGAVSAVDGVRVVNDGMQHLVVILNEELVARFPRDQAAARSLREEANLLGQLQGHVAVPLPVPVHAEDALASHPFTLHRMLEGADTTRSAVAALDQRARRRLLDDTGRFLRDLAAVEIDGLPVSVATTSQDRLQQLCRRADESIRPLLWRHQRDWLDEIISAVDQISFAHTPSLIHGDLAPYHLLHDPQSGQLTGVLDFGVAGLGDPAVDLGCLVATWGEKYCSELLRTWPEAVELADRARLIAMTLPLQWAVAALENDAADMSVAHLGHVALDVDPIGAPFGDRT